ncbi:MAG: DoxX family protein [Planctomycetota bacterium]|nr:DoxX family protein [Planctomycetota bacterium]
MSAHNIQPERNQLLNDTALLLIRIMLGVVFVFHGSQKLFGAFGGPGIEGFSGFLESLEVPMPLFSAWLASLAEFVGGLSLLLGLGVRLLAIPLVFTMGVAIFKTSGDAFDLQKGGMEYPLTLAVITLALALAGAGRFSLDQVVLKKRRSPKTA